MAKNNRVSVAMTDDEMAVLQVGIASWIRRAGRSMSMSEYIRDAALERAMRESEEVNE